jgi:hypothetical protein
MFCSLGNETSAGGVSGTTFRAVHRPLTVLPLAKRSGSYETVGRYMVRVAEQRCLHASRASPVVCPRLLSWPDGGMAKHVLCEAGVTAPLTQLVPTVDETSYCPYGYWQWSVLR